MITNSSSHWLCVAGTRLSPFTQIISCNVHNKSMRQVHSFGHVYMNVLVFEVSHRVKRRNQEELWLADTKAWSIITVFLNHYPQLLILRPDISYLFFLTQFFKNLFRLYSLSWLFNSPFFRHCSFFSYSTYFLKTL